MTRVGGKYIMSHKEVWSSGTSITVTHGFDTLDVLVIVRDVDTGELLTADTGWGNNSVGVTATDSDTVVLVMATAPSGSGRSITVVPL